MQKQQILNKSLSFKFGGMNENELSFLYDFCKNKNVLELGSMVGMSSYVLASVAQHVDCVDVWLDTQDHLSHDPHQQKIYKDFLPELPNMRECFIKNCEEFINNKKISMHIGTTNDMSKNFHDKTIDILLIDADHSYIGVSSDFHSYYNIVKDEGFILFHDYGWDSIKKFCNEVEHQNKICKINTVDNLAIFSKNFCHF